MPSALLEKKEPHPRTKAHPGHPQTKHAKEHQPTQLAESHRRADIRDRSGGQLLARPPALHKGGKEVASSAVSDDRESSSSDDDYDEDDNEDDSEKTSDDSSSATPPSQLSYVTRRRANTKARTNVRWRLKGPSKTTAPEQKTTRSQLAELQSNLDSRKNAAALEVTAEVQRRDTAIREGAYAKHRHTSRGGSHVGTPQSDVAPRDLGPDDRSSDIAQKLAAALATQNELRNTLATLANEIQNERHAREVAECNATADASVEGRRLRKRVKTVVEKSDEESHEDSDEESYKDSNEESCKDSDKESDKDSDEESYQDSDEESDEEKAVDTNVNRPARGRARAKNVSGLRVLPPLSGSNRTWTTKEEETLFNLRKQGKSWKYIGEELGRTAKAAVDRWGALRTASLQPIKTRSKRIRRFHSSSFLSALGEMGSKHRPWTKEEDSILISLRAQGKTIRYISGRLPGRGYDATQLHWLKIKSQYPQAVTASQAVLVNRPWTEEEDRILISLRAQGKTIKYISGRIPGRSILACKAHWLKNFKNQYPQAVTASQNL